jgi:hypothetical protein
MEITQWLNKSDGGVLSHYKPVIPAKAGIKKCFENLDARPQLHGGRLWRGHDDKVPQPL